MDRKLELNTKTINHPTAWINYKGLFIPALTIAFDKDEVLGRHTEKFLEWYGRNYGKKVNFSEVRSYNYGEILDISHLDYRSSVRQFQTSGDFEKIEPMPNSIEAIRKIKTAGHRMLIVTSRPPFLYDGTENWVETIHGLDTFAGGIRLSANGHDQAEGKSKGEICIEEEADILIEDLDLYALDAAGKGVIVFLHDRPWNKHVNHPFIQRFFDWKQVPEMVENERVKKVLRLVRTDKDWTQRESGLFVQNRRLLLAS